MADTLKPCPFCEGTDTLCAGYNVVLWIVCRSCGALGPTQNTEAEARAAWNRRADHIADAGKMVPTPPRPPLSREEVANALASVAVGGRVDIDVVIVNPLRAADAVLKLIGGRE